MEGSLLMATSYNGYAASPDKSAIGVVQSEWFPGGAKQGDVTTVLRYVAEQLHARVEPIVGGWCWGYNYRANVNNPSSLSCHASGTAIDWNAPEHPNGVRGTFSDAQRGEIYRILDEVQGAVHWLDGVDGGTADEMHFEICVDAATLARVAQELPGSRPPPSSGGPTMIPGEPTMFLSVHSLGVYALIGHVLFEFQNFEEYVQATESSPDIPVMGIGDKVPLGGRQWLVDRLNEQSVRATTG